MPTYDAFISYSHAKDKTIAAALQSVVQRLGKPWYRRRALRVFRDDTSLSATPHLWPSIEAALGQSRFLILFASPEAALSRWVAKEADYWLEHKSSETLLIALTAGELFWDQAGSDFRWTADTPLPAPLKGQFSTEPKWVDLRSYRDGANPRDHKFIELSADFAATVRGIPKEDLLSQEVRQQRRALMLAWSAAGSLLVLAGAAAWQWHEAVAQRDRAERTLAAATRTANSLVFDLAQRFRDQLGIPQAFIIRLLGQARTLVEDLARTGETRPDLMQTQGNALVELSSALLSQGEARSAVETATVAKSIFQALLTVDTTRVEWQTGLSVSYDRLGDALFRLNDRAGALAAYRQSLAINNRLEIQDSKGGNINHNIAVAYEKIGNVLAKDGNGEEALQQYRQSLALREALSRADPATSELQRELAVSYEKVGLVLASSGKIEDALVAFRRSLAIAEQLASSEPDNTKRQRDLATAYQKIGDALPGQGQRTEALDLYRKDLAIARRLAKSDPGRTDWQQDLVTSLERLAGARIQDQQPDEAVLLYREAITVSARIANQDSSRLEWQRDLALMYQKLAELLRNTGQLDAALTAYRESLGIRKKLVASKSTPAIWEGELAQNYQHIGTMLVDQGKSDAALTLAQSRVDFVRAVHYGANPDRALADALGNVGWYGLFARSFDQALAACEESIDLAPNLLWLRANRAHALMFSGATEAARSEYLAHKGEMIDERLKKTWDASVTEDFDIFRKANLTSPLMDEVEASWSK